jgi:hypothetical protein
MCVRMVRMCVLNRRGQFCSRAQRKRNAQRTGDQTLQAGYRNHDIRTPRGPSLDIRPRPEQCRAWGKQAGLRWVRDQALPGSPWHWGMLLEKHNDDHFFAPLHSR